MSQQLLFNKALDKLNVLFKYSGMKIDIKSDSKSHIEHRWYFIFNYLWVSSAVVWLVWYIFVIFELGTNFVELTSCAPCLIFSILALFKSALYCMEEKKVFRLLNIIKKLENDVLKHRLTEEKVEIYREDTNFLNAVLNVLYFLSCSMIIVFDLTPLIVIGVIFYNTSEFQMILPYMDVFVFLPNNLLIWVASYIYQTWSEMVVLLSMGASDYLLFTCCTFIKIQFRLLKVDLEELVPDEISFREMRSTGAFREQFCGLVMWHQELIESADILEEIYSKSNLVNFLFSSLVICLTSFNVTQSDNAYLRITFLTFLFMGLMQIFFLCFFADMLMDASTDISNAVYNCKWYITDPTVGMDLLLVQTRCNEPCKLTAFGFADVNLRAFMKILSTSWSYFALLQTIYES